jgi:hypothetical protein
VSEYWNSTDDIPGSGDISAENDYTEAWNATVDAALGNGKAKGIHRGMAAERKKLKQNKVLMDWAKKRRRESAIKSLKRLNGDRYELEITFEDNK